MCITADYYNASISTDHQPPKWYSGIYSTDVLGDMSIEHIEEASKGDAPWFVGSEWRPSRAPSETVLTS